MKSLVKRFGVVISLVTHVIAASVAWISPSSVQIHRASVAALLLTFSGLIPFAIAVNLLLSCYCRLGEQLQDGDRMNANDFVKRLLFSFAYGIAGIMAIMGLVFIAIGVAAPGLDGKELAAGVSTIVFAVLCAFVDLTMALVLIRGACCIQAYEPLN